jgi:hypothetical protein
MSKPGGLDYQAIYISLFQAVGINSHRVCFYTLRLKVELEGQQ